MTENRVLRQGLGAKVSENFTHAHHQGERSASKPLMRHDSSKLAPDWPPTARETGMESGECRLKHLDAFRALNDDSVLRAALVKLKPRLRVRLAGEEELA